MSTCMFGVGMNLFVTMSQKYTSTFSEKTLVVLLSWCDFLPHL